MTLRILRTLDDCQAAGGDWDRLAAGVPFRGLTWLSTWWRHYATPGSQLLVLAVQADDGRLVGLAPWYVEPGRAGERTIRFLGSGEVCSDFLTIMHDPPARDDVVAAVADWLLAHAATPGSRASDGWTMLHLDGGSADDPMLVELARRLNDGGALVRARSPMNTWRLTFDADWEQYLARLSKSHRKQLRRAQRDLFEPGRAVWRGIGSSSDFAAAWELFVDLHQRRRQSLGEAGCFHSSRFTAFLRDVAQQLHQTGQLRLNWLELDGRAAASEFHLGGGDGVVYAFQSGLDPTLLEHEPGRLAAMATIRAAVDDGFRAIDYLRGDEPYKAHWRAEPAPTLELKALPSGVIGRARYGLWQMRDVLKRLTHAPRTEARASVDVE